MVHVARPEVFNDPVPSISDRRDFNDRHLHLYLVVAEDLAKGAVEVGEAALVVASAGELDPNGLRQLALGVRERIDGPAVVVVGSTSSGKGALVGVATKDLVEKGVSAGELVAVGAPKLGGGGSRDPELAQAGGPDGSNLEAALDAIREEAGRRLSAI